MKLTSPGEVRRLMERYGLRFQKGYGQNFLVNDAIPARIAASCGASPGDGILEIGPGIGTLTRELCARYRKVIAIEIDRGLLPVLAETTADFDNLTVINDDVLKVDLPALVEKELGDGPVTVCANLPYYITTPILMRLLESDRRFTHITVMIQKEVAARLCAAPGEPDYGAVTAAVARYGRVERLFAVSAGSFLPAPKVDSAVIRITPDPVRRYTVKDETVMGRTIRGAFALRRKTLVNSLASEFPLLTKEEIASAVVAAGLPPDIRGERLGIPQFARLSDALTELITTKENPKGNT